MHRWGTEKGDKHKAASFFSIVAWKSIQINQKKLIPHDKWVNFSSYISLEKLYPIKALRTPADLRAEVLSEFVNPPTKKNPFRLCPSSVIDPVPSSLTFTIGGKGNSLEWSAPVVGTRKNVGKEQTTVSGSHLSHLIVLSVVTVVALALCLLVCLLLPSSFQGTCRTSTFQHGQMICFYLPTD